MIICCLAKPHRGQAPSHILICEPNQMWELLACDEVDAVRLTTCG
jgi:hypothetical protein